MNKEEEENWRRRNGGEKWRREVEGDDNGHPRVID